MRVSLLDGPRDSQQQHLLTFKMDVSSRRFDFSLKDFNVKDVSSFKVLHPDGTGKLVEPPLPTGVRGYPSIGKWALHRLSLFGGIPIIGVEPGGNAEAAGIRNWDVLYEVDGGSVEKLHRAAALELIEQAVANGGVLDVVVVRDEAVARELDVEGRVIQGDYTARDRPLVLSGEGAAVTSGGRRTSAQRKFVLR
mmetsp:Transcript_22026/g.52380  ORF Transcript_22026/g.52380 Transcript_22026/m.52380 type:complete len:194 (-) Transcript_22026:1193-1774(-)